MQRFYNEEKEINKLRIQNKNINNYFSAFNLSDQNWKNGISLKQNVFFISKRSSVILKVGDTLEFPTGTRNIVKIDKNSKYENIYVDGKKLDPIKDGYPNKIKIIKEMK